MTTRNSNRSIWTPMTSGLVLLILSGLDLLVGAPMVLAGTTPWKYGVNYIRVKLYTNFKKN